MKAIVCVDENWGIGYEGDLLFHIPADMKYFKEKTMGNVVIMGISTFRSLPGQKPLTDRVNIVLTSDESWSAPGVVPCHSLDELFETLKRYDSSTVFVIGGASVYEQALPLATRLCLTEVDDIPAQADTFFPAYDSWKEVQREDHETDEKHHFRYSFVDYVRCEHP